ncbi:hypothetical protein E1162_16220 [Rhodobacteraceae bacterium RKSG542]|uniref:thermonuclease family protein n=1 Tax=Pseudovibrio flavus TaxID=2529854 RepID=UPI0012BC8ABA|nr:hypothetical protein [Pseudovibrio flavus]MTI18793.1 hypothetical protein [Pseudovibrio flavus]
MKRVIIPLFVCAVGIAALGTLALQSTDKPIQPDGSAVILYKPSTLPEPEPQKEQARMPQMVQKPDQLRQITGDGISPPPPTTDGLMRISAASKKVEEEPQDTFVVRRPMVLDGATFMFKNKRYRLINAEPLTIEETCKSYMGGQWPCGMRARTALRAFLLQMAISCSKTDSPTDAHIYVRCKRGEQDVTEWLLSQGWAHASESAPLKVKLLSKVAKDGQKGIWQARQSPVASSEFIVPAATNPPIATTADENQILIQTEPPILWKPAGENTSTTQ